MAIKPKTMTTQEYVKKEAERLTESAIPGTMESETGMLAKQEYKNGAYHGLSAGIELAKECLDFAVNKFFSVERLDGKTYWAKSCQTGKIQYLTTSELFEIFLTERNESTKV